MNPVPLKETISHGLWGSFNVSFPTCRTSKSKYPYQIWAIAISTPLNMEFGEGGDPEKKALSRYWRHRCPF